MAFENLKNYDIILASKSPRRKQLLEDLGLKFSIKIIDVDEVYPHNLPIDEIPSFLAKLKAKPFIETIDEQTLIITSDTIVCCENNVLGKPTSPENAYEMLRFLSGKIHQVKTGVCILTTKKTKTFTSTTDVYFKHLSDKEIWYYINNYKPFDKAGAYGIQEWIGFVAVEQINGSYFNVMGLPIHQLYEELISF